MAATSLRDLRNYRIGDEIEQLEGRIDECRETRNRNGFMVDIALDGGKIGGYTKNDYRRDVGSRVTIFGARLDEYQGKDKLDLRKAKFEVEASSRGGDRAPRNEGRSEAPRSSTGYKSLADMADVWNLCLEEARRVVNIHFDVKQDVFGVKACEVATSFFIEANKAGMGPSLLLRSANRDTDRAEVESRSRSRDPEFEDEPDDVPF